jgi:hypothetical protein
MLERLRAALGDDARINVIIVDGGTKVGAALGDNVSKSVVEATTAMGVQWKVNTSVVSVDDDGAPVRVDLLTLRTVRSLAGESSLFPPGPMSVVLWRWYVDNNATDREKGRAFESPQGDEVVIARRQRRDLADITMPCPRSKLTTFPYASTLAVLTSFTFFGHLIWSNPDCIKKKPPWAERLWERSRKEATGGPLRQSN